jgi:CheY-like chemotaxis protein
VGRVILIVDDDEDMRDAYRDALELAGFRARVVGDGREALEQLRSDEEIGLILLDLMMPGMNGWDVWAELQRDPRLKQIPVVVATAGDSTLPGAAATVSKVAELHELLAVIRHHLR